MHIGHSTDSGEVAHYLGRHGESRVAKAALISAVPPLMVKTEKNPGDLPKKKRSMACRRSSRLTARNSYRDLASGLPVGGFPTSDHRSVWVDVNLPAVQ